MADLNQILKSKLEQAEVPYNPEHWTEMEQKLNAQASGMSNKVKGFIGAAAVVAGVTLGGLFMDSDSAQLNKVDSVEIAVIANDNTTTSSENVSQDNENLAGNTTNDVVEAIGNHANVLDEKLNVNTDVVNADIESITSNENSEVNGNKNTKSGSASSSWGKFSVSATQICEGKGITFSIDGIVNPVSFLWSFGDGSTDNTPNPTHIYKTAGVYDVSLTLTEISSGADTTQTKENLITILAAPNVDLDWELSNVLDIDAQVSFEALGLSYSETVLWSLGDGSTSTEAALLHTYGTDGIKKVSLIATNPTTGCTTELEENVKVENDYNLLAPTGFNPKSLINENKTFIPVGLKNLGDGHSFVFEIFNPRKGMERVYKTNQYVGWNGKFENVGETLPAGIYSWQAIVKRPDGSEKKFVKSVTLLQ
jgi:PKD repeat protein